MRLLVTLLAYTTGIMMGYFIQNTHLLFALLTIPVMVVFLILERKQRGVDEFIKKVESLKHLSKEEQDEALKSMKNTQ